MSWSLPGLVRSPEQDTPVFPLRPGHRLSLSNGKVRPAEELDAPEYQDPAESNRPAVFQGCAQGLGLNGKGSLCKVMSLLHFTSVMG